MNGESDTSTALHEAVLLICCPDCGHEMTLSFYGDEQDLEIICRLVQISASLSECREAARCIRCSLKKQTEKQLS